MSDALAIIVFCCGSCAAVCRMMTKQHTEQRCAIAFIVSGNTIGIAAPEKRSSIQESKEEKNVLARFHYRLKYEMKDLFTR